MTEQELRQRKPEQPAASTTAAPPKAKTTTKTAVKGSASSSCVGFLVAVLLMLATTASVSFVLTNSLTFGYNPHKLWKLIPVSDALKDWAHGIKREEVPQSTPASTSPSAAINNSERKHITLTTAELKQYDGSDPSKPIYLAINGKVYDVSAGEKYYGKEGGYKFFAGVDAARAYITGCFETHLIPDLRGLSEAEIESLSTWSDFYEKHDKYFYVGQVIHDPIPEDAPLPEPCM